ANAAIVLVKEASTSAARVASVSAVSVGPGLYRITLNSTDTDTLGTLVVFASVSGGLPFRYDTEIWQSTTHALYYGSADQIATSAIASAVVVEALADFDVATSADVSAIVSAVVQAVSMTSGSVSSLIHNVLVNYDVASSADVS